MNEAAAGEETKRTLQKSLFDRAVDGCHRFGWIISIAVYLLTLAYFLGGQNSALENMKDKINDSNARISRIETLLLNRN